MTSIFVAKLDYGVDQEDLKSLFEQHGKVNKVTIAFDRETGKSRGFAFIEMFNSEEANEAIDKLNGHELKGRQIAVKQAEDRSNSKPSPQRTSPAPRRTDSESPFNNSPEEPNTSYSKSPTPSKFSSNKKSGKGKGSGITDGRPRVTKMKAYKKSGKNKSYLDYDEDEDY